MTDTLIRKATQADLPAIIAMLADDPLGSQREVVSDPVDARYLSAFAAIDSDPNQLLVVAAEGEQVVGCAQITFIPGLSRTGMWRGQIESVRIAETHRRGGLGRRMFEWAIDACRERRCGLVQLTTDKTRPDAARFYEALGFVASHEGMKLAL
ncbi:ribosomal protein S18 acetylase RimI-like enzyme [Phyllobacterium myrsinacearum]|uniref:Ribosomal protein S18 acetylase RimI-like enzyme n=2 Tax=Phyllobacterium myrsinacearum TaxID=28101 RepID=A0A839EAE9_9HYPH|nr:ribosomal protein S18 acetylase RimI-like enzyme [Phyllobacterium myrsinacearum]